MKNKKPKDKKLIKNMNMAGTAAAVQEDLEKLILGIREEEEEQTWPVWLTAQAFQDWYNHEQKRRRSDGMMPLPNPPPEVIQKIMS